jgi:hypothetical protein
MFFCGGALLATGYFLPAIRAELQAMRRKLQESPDIFLCFLSEESSTCVWSVTESKLAGSLNFESRERLPVVVLSVADMTKLCCSLKKGLSRCCGSRLLDQRSSFIGSMTVTVVFCN